MSRKTISHPKAKAILKVEIRWSKRSGRVTSLVGGHTAKIVDLGDVMEITILENVKVKGDVRQRN